MLAGPRQGIQIDWQPEPNYVRINVQDPKTREQPRFSYKRSAALRTLSVQKRCSHIPSNCFNKPIWIVTAGDTA